MSGSGLPTYTLANICDVSRSPLQLAQADAVDTQVSCRIVNTQPLSPLAET